MPDRMATAAAEPAAVAARENELRDFDDPRPEKSMTPPGTPSGFEIRPATRADVPAIHAMIGLLADYEKLAHLNVSREADLASALFGERPAAEVLIACQRWSSRGLCAVFPKFFDVSRSPGAMAGRPFRAARVPAAGMREGAAPCACRHRPRPWMRTLRVGRARLECLRDRVLPIAGGNRPSRLAHRSRRRRRARHDGFGLAANRSVRR